MIGAVLLILSGLSGTSQVSAPAAPEQVDFCEVIESPRKFDNRVISTRGVLLPGEHSLGFYASACIPTETKKVSTQGVMAPEVRPKQLANKLRKLFKRQSAAEVKAEGTFHSDGGPFGPDVASFRFVIQRLTSVESSRPSPVRSNH